MHLYKKMSSVVLAAALISSGVAMPAFADGFSVSLDKTAHLVHSGDRVTVTISGLPEGEGIYVRQCAAPAVEGNRPSTCVGISDTVWTSLDSTSTNQGASPFTGTVELAVKRTFTASNATAVDCELVSCGVLVRRDHLNPTDFSLDTFVPITFAPEYSVSVSKTSAIRYSGEAIQVLVSGLSTDQGVYVRLCQQSDVVGQRPSLCDGMGAWASNSVAMQGFGALSPDSAIDLTVRGSFTSGENKVDCAKVSCGIFVRRDHLDPTDNSLDTFVPVTFSAAPVAKKISAKIVNKQILVSVTGYKNVAVRLKAGNSTFSFTPDANVFTYRIPLGKQKNVSLAVLKGSSLLFSKRLNN